MKKQDIALNIKLIDAEMTLREMTRPMLQKRWRMSRQALHYVFNAKPVSYAGKFGRLFNRPAKDFIV